MLTTLVFVYVSIIFTTIYAQPWVNQVQVQNPNAGVSDPCLSCICYASSKCDKNIGCTEAGACGPFLISWGYWTDGGRFVIKGTDPNDAKAYPQCASDTYCAAETVRGYMEKYGRDCNGDGRVDCEDFARIHKRGPGACQDPNIQETDYYRQFATCSAQLHP